MTFATGSPPVATLDPYDPATVGDPFPLYDWLRTNDPVRHVAERDIWLVSRWDDVATAAADARRFSSAETNGRERRRLAVLVGADPPEHTRLRRQLAPAFTPRALEAWPEHARMLAGEHVDRIVGGEHEIVGELAEPLACRFLADILGVPARAIVELRHGRALRPSPRVALARTFGELADRRRAEPGDDLVSTLVTAGALTRAEIVNVCVLLLAAGADTTRDLAANLVLELASRPEQWALLRTRPGLAGSAVEEVLRFTSPIQAMFRTATDDVALSGTTVPGDARVMLLFGSANRDEARWADAGTFDVARYANGIAKHNHHMAFGAGPHACLGAWLGRVVATALLSELINRVSSLRTTGPVSRGRNPCFRSIASLPVETTG